MVSTSNHVPIVSSQSHDVCTEQLLVVVTGQFNVLSAKDLGLWKVGLFARFCLVIVEIGDGGTDSVREASREPQPVNIYVGCPRNRPDKVGIDM